MTNSPVRVDEIPEPPDDRSCSGGCGKVIKPEWFPGAEMGTIRLKGRWQFDDPCDACWERRGSEQTEREEKSEAAERRRRLVEILGGDKAATEFTFDRFVPRTPSQETAIAEARAFSPGESNLYLWGKRSGTGKTHLASAIAAAAFAANLRVEFWKPGALIRAYRLKEPHEHEKMLRRMATSDVFVLDDLGVGKATEFATSVLYEIADMRDMASKAGLVVTSNLSLGEIATKLDDDRLSSRLAGLCRGHIIEVEGPDGRSE